MNYLNDLHKKNKINSSIATLPPKMKTPLRILYIEELFERESLVTGDVITVLFVNANDDIFLYENAIFIRKDGSYLSFIDLNNSEIIDVPLDRIITFYNIYHS